MHVYLPYIVSVLCAVIAGFTSYAVARKQAKVDMQKLQKEHELDIEKEREKFKMEKEKMEIEHRHQLELQKKEAENSISSSLTTSIIGEIMKMPEVRQQINHGLKNGTSKKR